MANTKCEHISSKAWPIMSIATDNVEPERLHPCTYPRKNSNLPSFHFIYVINEQVAYINSH